jgi:hypothetical protein
MIGTSGWVSSTTALSMRSAQRGQQVLDGLDRYGLARETGLILDPAEVRDRRGDFEAAQVAPLKPDPVVIGSRLERQRHLVPGVEAYAGAGDRTTEGALRVHDLSGEDRYMPICRCGGLQLSATSAKDLPPRMLLGVSP